MPGQRGRWARNFGLGVGRAEVGELGEQVVVGFEAGRRDLPVAQPGEASTVDVVGSDAAVGVGSGLAAVVVQDIGQYLQRCRLGRLGGVAAVFQDAPRTYLPMTLGVRSVDLWIGTNRERLRRAPG
jgi:hypothetical protein